MCGLTGFRQANNFSAEEARATALGMAERISHRGPDDSGVWVDKECGIALAHRRLSIVDLSSAGHQPMVSASERFVIAFNGEIYNHLEMRRELEGMDCHASLAMTGSADGWRGHSDTETLLAGLRHGVWRLGHEH